jgi:L-lactate permease
MGSNMTQGAIQAVAAERLGVSVTSMLAVQVAGACAGKMVCISSILVSGMTDRDLSGLHTVGRAKNVEVVQHKVSI